MISPNPAAHSRDISANVWLRSTAESLTMLFPDFNPAVLPEDQVQKALALVNAWQSQLIARLVTPSTTSTVTPEAENHDNLLTVEECAQRLRRSPKWIYRGVKSLPFARKLGPRSWVFSEQGLQKWILRQMP
jgi:predicted DNA-binding transcriptional regulator AlpA